MPNACITTDLKLFLPWWTMKEQGFHKQQCKKQNIPTLDFGFLQTSWNNLHESKVLLDVMSICTCPKVCRQADMLGALSYYYFKKHTADSGISQTLQTRDQKRFCSNLIIISLMSFNWNGIIATFSPIRRCLKTSSTLHWIQAALISNWL